MLFDLRGKRRRAVQATYLILAVLMGGGLVLFGIGGSGGNIFDAFDSSSGDSGNEQLEKRIDRLETKLRTSPDDAVALAALVKANYQVAVSQTPSGTTAIPEEGKDDLRKAGRYWERYVEASNSEPSPDLAKYALNVYSPDGLNQPAKAKEAVRILAADANDAQTYLLLVQYATAAKDTRTAKLAAQKAVELAPKNQRKEVEKAAKQLQNAAPQQQ
jgi:cytochrome c-type biogenesis protein CcmH/NrfG